MRKNYFLIILTLIIFPWVLSCSDDNYETLDPSNDIETPDDNNEIFPEEEPDNETFDYEGFEFLVIDGEAAIKTLPEKEEIFIPKVYIQDEQSYPVTKILKGADTNNTIILHVPESIKAIESIITPVEILYIEDLTTWANIDFGFDSYNPGNDHFYYCHTNPISLKTKVYCNGKEITGGELVLPSGITQIKPFAFQNLNITGVKLGPDVEEIGYNAFMNCLNLKDISFNSNLTTIKSEAFRETAVENLNFPENLKTIESLAFYNCRKLTTISLPENLERVGAMVFPYVTNINIASIKSWLNIDFSVINVDGGVNIPFWNEYELYIDGKPVKDISIPAGISTIRNYAFYNSKIESVQFPISVSKIWNDSFSNCNYLTELKLPGSLEYIEGFSSNKNLKTVTISQGTISLGSSLDNAFWECPKLESLYLPFTVQNCDLSFLKTSPEFKAIYLDKCVPNVKMGSNKEFDFSGINLYVSPEILEQCRNHEVWGKFNIVSL